MSQAARWPLHAWKIKEEGAPRTRYLRIATISPKPKAPLVDRARKVVTISIPMSPKLAYLGGVLLGDGSISNRRLTFYNSDRQLLGFVALELQSLTDSKRRRPSIIHSTTSGVPSIHYSNSALARLIGRSQSERIRFVRASTATSNLLAAFLGGFFDSEGSVTTYSNKSHTKGAVEVSIANSCLEVLTLLSAKLQHKGIHAGISLSAGPRTSIIQGRLVKGKKTVYRMRCSGWKSATKFARMTLPWVQSESKKAKLNLILEITNGVAGI